MKSKNGALLRKHHVHYSTVVSKDTLSKELALRVWHRGKNSTQCLKVIFGSAVTLLLPVYCCHFLYETLIPGMVYSATPRLLLFYRELSAGYSHVTVVTRFSRGRGGMQDRCQPPLLLNLSGREGNLSRCHLS